MRKPIITTILASSFCAPLIYAQVAPLQPQPSQAPQETQEATQETTPSTPQHGTDVPIIDPTNKTVQFQGHKYSLADNNIGGQFDAFLATDTLSSDAAKEYRAVIREILNSLSPNKKVKPDLTKAYVLLSKAAEYPGDGGVSDSLVNALSAARNSQKGKGALKAELVALNEEQKKLVRKMKIIEGKTQFQNDAKSEGKSNRRTENLSTEFQAFQGRLKEIDLIKRKIETQAALTVGQAKLQYQSMLIQLFVQRRFEHVIMGTRFYNLVFSDGDTNLKLKKNSDVESFFSDFVGVNPTVAGLDAAANEAIRKVKTLVSAFNNNMTSNRTHAAAERLVEAFVIGEFIPVVQTIPIAAKERIQQYTQDANDMVKTLEARDLEKAEKLNEKLMEQARDYNESEAKSYINGLKTVSKGAARDAQLAILQILEATKLGNTKERYVEQDRFREAMTIATKAWPSNPDLEKLNKRIDNIINISDSTNDLLAKARRDFDGWMSTQSYTAIFNHKEKLGGAFGISSDPEDKDRLSALHNVISNKTDIFKALEKAETLKESGFEEAAWEVIHRTQKDYQNDIELARAMATYSSSAAEFAKIISNAQEIEEKDAGSFQALSYFLKAKSMNPDSKYVNEGIERILTTYNNE